MTIPVTQLDDRRFDDLVAEARTRLLNQLPELAQIAEGDPLYALTDLFAWLTETVIYRANLIPERQRQAFLNLLQLPLRPAVAARGLISVDAKLRRGVAALPPLIEKETALKAGSVDFVTDGELQPLPLAMSVLVKQRIDQQLLDELGISKAQLETLYGTEVSAFRPRTLTPGIDPLSLADSLDGHYYLLLYLPDPKTVPRRDAIREQLAGQRLNIGLAPQDELPGDIETASAPRPLRWELAFHASAEDNQTRYLPLDVEHDGSHGGRRSGVVRLRLPRSAAALGSDYPLDPKRAGLGNTPPEPPAGITAEQVICWLRLSAPEDADLPLGHIAVNAVEVIGQGVVRDRMLGIGNGQPRQQVTLPHTDVDPATLDLQVSESGAFVRWLPVAHFADAGPEDRVYRLDPASATVQFGNGQQGRRPPANSRIRAAFYRHGGGSAGNLPAGSISQIEADSARLSLRHEWPTRGGRDAETVAEAERRIPAHLVHRERAVTRDDFAVLARDNPVNPVGRAIAVPGLLPGASIDSVREDIPGVVSLFVLPPALPVSGGVRRPSKGLLRDVYRYLDARKLAGTELYVLSPEFVALAISLSVRVDDPTTATEIGRAVDRAVIDYLWPLAPGGRDGQGWPLGGGIDPAELQAVAARVAGVRAVQPPRLFRQRDDQWDEVNGKLNLTRYQLPEVLQVQTTVGEERPEPPELVKQPEPSGPLPIPAPVVPDLC